MMKRLDEINREIERLKTELETIRGTNTEVYSRIVGYYRSVKNWNMGKREEYSHRVQFSRASCVNPQERSSSGPASVPETGELSIAYFFRKQCPNCPPVSSLLSKRNYPYAEIDVDSEAGLAMAGEFNILSTPTVLVRTASGEEVFRSSNARTIDAYLEGITQIAYVS